MKKILWLLALPAFSLLPALNAQQAVPPPPRPDAADASAPAPADSRPAAPADSRVEDVIEAVKAHLSDDEIIASLRKDYTRIPLSLHDLSRLKAAGASDFLIKFLLNPSQTPAASSASGSALAPVLAHNYPVTVLPSSKDAGTSLVSSLNYLQTQISEQIRITYMAEYQDETLGTSWKSLYSDEYSEVSVKPATCQIVYHWKEALGDHVIFHGHRDLLLNLRDIRTIELLTAAQYHKRQDANAGHLSWTAQVKAPIFVVLAHTADAAESPFFFAEEQQANRVGEVLAYAVSLCAGN
ncbi:MAG: hypothetical protein WB424_02470 [Terracidiphilus sp.]|jgi:hypothetical protein